MPVFQALPLPPAHLRSKRKQLLRVVLLLLLLPAFDKVEFKRVGWEMHFPAWGRAGELCEAAARKGGKTNVASPGCPWGLLLQERVI